MSAWLPSDDQLDALSRGLPPLTPDAQRAEQARTTLLAGAATATQQPRRSVAHLAAAIALPLAAAAAIAIWVGTRSDAPKDTIISVGAAEVEYASGWPDQVVVLRAGTIDVDLQVLDARERFRVRGPDGEVETRDGHFTIEVRADRVAAVTVSRGQVEMRLTGGAPFVVASGQSWAPPIITTQRDVILPTSENTQAKPAAPTPADPPPTVPTVPKPARPVVIARTPTEKPPTSVPIEAPKAPAPPSPGEAEFRAGMIALRNGDAGAAAASFASACSTANAALAEDACFWAGAAAHRAKQIATARDALARFLQRFPSSSRAGEAAALLGWILFDAGDLDNAERRFKQAANDRVPKVRESATRGLTAIERKRGK